MTDLLELPKLANSQAAMFAATKAGLVLQERGWTRYSPVSWEMPAIVAMAGDRCVGGINYHEDLDALTLHIDFAFADLEYPGVLVRLLSRFRAKYRGSKFSEIRFACHEGNEPMAKAVKVLGLSPISYAFRLPISGLSRKAEPV